MVGKVLKWGVLAIALLAVTLFIEGVRGGSFNDKVLNELSGDIIYTRRDEAGVLNLYRSKANLQNEVLLYSHKSHTNSNIIAIDYDEDNQVIYFVAFNDDLMNWDVYELVDGRVRLSNKFSSEQLEEQVYNRNLETEDYKLYSENGDLFLLNKITDEKTKLKDFKGIRDAKFSGGYGAKGISEDGQYVFYSYGKHLTPMGVILEGLISDNFEGETYVMNIQTKEVSRYINFYDLIFVD